MWKSIFWKLKIKAQHHRLKKERDSIRTVTNKDSSLICHILFLINQVSSIKRQSNKMLTASFLTPSWLLQIVFFCPTGDSWWFCGFVKQDITYYCRSSLSALTLIWFCINWYGPVFGLLLAPRFHCVRFWQRKHSVSKVWLGLEREVIETHPSSLVHIFFSQVAIVPH